MDAEFADLIPLFAEEARDRLHRLATTAPLVEGDRGALAEARRELHTLKGAGRMMQIPALSELCHAAEEMLVEPHPGQGRLLLRVADRLAAMVEAVAAGAEAEADAELLALLAGGGDLPSAEVDASAVGAGHDVPAAARPAPAATAGEPAPAAAAESAPASPATGSGGHGGSAGNGAPSAENRRAGLRLDTGALDALAERATQMRLLALGFGKVVDRLYELAKLAEGGLREPQPTQVLAGLATMLRGLAVDVEGRERRLEQSADEQIERALALQLQPLRTLLQTLARSARDLARALGREIDVEIAGEETRLDRRIVRELEEALIHLVRNAVDHGIERPAARAAAGKSAVGRLRIEAQAEGARVRLAIEDDGAGVDPERVRERAIAAGLLEAHVAATLPRDAVLRFLFAPGFSTRDQVSETSGRGVGLDAVASAVARVGGEVFFDAEPGRGARVEIGVPVARRGEGVLVLSIAGVKLGLPAASARRTVRLAGDAVVERDGRSLARVGDQLIAFVPLARLAGRADGGGRMLVLGAASGQPFAVAVDDVLGEEEVLVRPLARAAQGDRLIDGVALLSSGEPIGVLAPAALVERGRNRQPIARVESSAVRRVRVLLVDDSLVTREMERRLLEDAGFEVAAVVDAAEALSRLGEQGFDCVVTDVEMPGMDGFELTARLRSMEHFAQLPIVVVSTRDRSEDRLRGLAAGADAYLAKQSLNALELVDLVRRLSGRFAP